jgi:glycosyltransferase involved in cell wall biosynthesis
MKNNIVVIPFYNEANRLQKEFLFEVLNNDDLFFLFVNDGSTDNTLKLLNDLIKNKNNVIILSNKTNIGKAESIRNAVQYSILNLKPETLGYFDCDFATPFYEYRRLLNIFNESRKEIVFGSRINLLGTNIVRNPYRHYFSRIVVTFLNTIFKLGIYDTQCGCKIFNGNTLSHLFSKKFKTKWLFDIEIFIKYFKSFDRSNVLEVSLNDWKEIPGSKIKMKDFISVPIEIFKLIFFYKLSIKSEE